jgi:hypothetical protein
LSGHGRESGSGSVVLKGPVFVESVPGVAFSSVSEGKVVARELGGRDSFGSINAGVRFSWTLISSVLVINWKFGTGF